MGIDESETYLIEQQLAPTDIGNIQFPICLERKICTLPSAQQPSASAGGSGMGQLFISRLSEDSAASEIFCTVQAISSSSEDVSVEQSTVANPVSGEYNIADVRPEAWMATLLEGVSKPSEACHEATSISAISYRARFFLRCVMLFVYTLTAGIFFMSAAMPRRSSTEVRGLCDRSGYVDCSYSP